MSYRGRGDDPQQASTAAAHSENSIDANSTLQPDADVDTQYKNAKKLLLTLHSQLEALETGSDQSVLMQGKIAMNINALSRIVNHLQTQSKLMPLQKRDVWAMKCRQLSEDEKQVRAAMERFLLLANANRPSTSSSSLRTDPSSQARMQRLNQDSQSLNTSQRVANEIREIGSGILEQLRNQNKTLKRARRTVWNIAHTLGLSRALLRVIERRQYQDQILVYGGMIVTLIILVLLIYFFRW
jgi:golgi SNAP receptor complex member 2